MLARAAADDRVVWTTVGKALLEAREQFPNPVQFGMWIKAEEIDKIPGLATASSRSDCIWLAERPLCASLISVEITNPRGVRQAWRKLLVASAKAWGASGAVYESAVHHVMAETHASEAEAQGALGLVASIEPTPMPYYVVGVVPVTKTEAALFKALVKAKKAGLVTQQVLDAAASAGFAVTPPVAPAHPWTPPEDAATPIDRFEHALRMALIEGVMPAEIDALIPTVTYYNAEMAYERARSALELAKEQAFDLEEAKAMVKDVYLGDF